jgi:hypothetical protein
MQNQRMPKQIPASTTEQKRTRGISHNRKRHKIEEDLKYNGNKKKNCQAMIRDYWGTE